MRLWVLLLLSLSLTPLASAQLSVPITVQPAEWTGQLNTVTGTRNDAPVTFGLGIPDSANIPCTIGSSPAQLELKSGTSQLPSQFRTLGCWPDHGGGPHVQWVLIDAQLPSFAEGSPGYDTSITLTQVSSGGGNFPAGSGNNLATQCTGSGTPVSACPDSNHILVNTTSAIFLIKQNNYNLFDDVSVSGAHLVLAANHGTNDGLFLLGPSHTQYALQTIDSVSCNPGPIPTNYSGPTTCATPYTSNNDSSSTCSIEENGPLRAALMCQGNMVNSNGDIYLRWRTRMHFWANHSDTKVTIAIRNADVPTSCCKTPNFTNAYKEYTQLEARVTDNLATTSRNFDIANNTGTPTTGTFSVAPGSTDNVFLWQAYANAGEWPDWNANSSNSNNCTHESDACVQSYIPRSGTSTRQYSLSGFAIQQSISGTVGIPSNGTFAQYPVGWADIDDSHHGIEVGVYQLSMYWPKSLEFQQGTPNSAEVRIGIWPNQQEFPSSLINSAYNVPPVATNSAAQVSYVTGWPQYQIHDLYFNFHTGTLSPTIAQQDFLYFQHYLLGRPQNSQYYNSVADSTDGFLELINPIPVPAAEDNYYTSLGLCTTAQCVADVGNPGYPYNQSCSSSCTGPQAGMKIFRMFTWENGGGTAGNQAEQRLGWLRNWLQRGGAGITGSLPGRYIWASHWYRMIVEKSLPRSDTPTTSGTGAGFRSLLTSQSIADNSGFFPWGDPKNNGLPSVWNGGMRNWGDADNSMDHSVYWGIFLYYFLSGDEFVKEQLLQGFKDRYQNPFVPYNNVYAFASSNGAPGHGHINAVRAAGHWMNGAAWMMKFLRSVQDPDADITIPTSPGTSPATSTVLQGLEQILATEVVLPGITSSYPQGFVDADPTNCPPQLNSFAQVCSQGSSPVLGAVLTPTSVGGQGCGTPWKKSHAQNIGDVIADSNGDTETVAVAGTTGTSNPTWTLTIGGTTIDGGVTWTMGNGASPQGRYNFPCATPINPRGSIAFQLAAWANGLHNVRQVMRHLYGNDWHASVGTAGTIGPSCLLGGSGQSVATGGFCDGATGPFANVQIGDKILSDRFYAASQRMKTIFINTGSFGTSGFPFAQYDDYLNTTPPCQSGGDCSHTNTACLSGCNGTNEWAGIAAAAETSNSTRDLNGDSWQFSFEAQAKNSGIITQDLGGDAMQYAVNYILNSGSTNANSYTVNSSTPQIKPVIGFAVTGVSSGSTFTPNGCVNNTGSPGTCTLTWPIPPGLTPVAGVSYRLKYLPCQAGTLTMNGNDCPVGGKAIVPDLLFHSDITTAGFPAPGSPGYSSNTLSGSWQVNPATNWNWAFTTDIPDGAANPGPIASPYTFHTSPNTTYTFDLRGYVISNIYYISQSTGSDSNTPLQARSKSTPWKNLPGMLAATGNSASYSPQPGDIFVLMGCDVWPNASFPITWTSSGTSTSPITITRDTSWFNFSSCTVWGRPIFDAGSTAIQAPECTSGHKNFYIVATGAMYVTFQWIEARNYFWNSAQGSSCFGSGGFFQGINSDYITLDNWYFHRWATGSSATDNDHMIAAANSTTNCLNCLVSNSVFDNSDGNGNSGVGLQFNALNNVIHDVTNAIKPVYQGEFGGNNIYNIRDSFDGTTHPNCIETVGALGPSHTYFIHDNYIHDAVTCEGLQIGNTNEVDYVWNNLWFNMTHAGANGPNLPQGGSSTKSLFYWNNTNVDQRGVCAAVGSNGNKWSTAFVMQNNHCITNGTPTGTTQSSGMVDQNITGASTITFSNNLVESLSSANSQGYTNTQLFVYSPTLSTSPTVGTGTNLTSSWPAGFSTNDTNLACTEQVLSGVTLSICPQRTPNGRPASPTPFDIGAYDLLVGGMPSMAPSTKTFASTLVGSPSTDSPFRFVVTNGTSSTITLGTPTITDTTSSYTLFPGGTGVCGTTLAAGATCNLYVVFSPTLAGTISATLNQPITGLSTLTSSMSGTGIAPSVFFSVPLSSVGIAFK